MLKFAKAERGPDAEIPPFRLHDLRRSCASGMASIGIRPHIIESVLNHVSGFKSGVAGTYNVHAYEPEKRQALVRWSEHVQRIVSGQTGKVITMHSERPRVKH
jgi:integrase